MELKAKQAEQIARKVYDDARDRCVDDIAIILF